MQIETNFDFAAKKIERTPYGRVVAMAGINSTEKHVVLEQYALHQGWHLEYDLSDEVYSTDFGVILTEDSQEIVYVDEKIENMTGYSLAQMEYRNPRFLQGLKSDRKVVQVMREALDKAEPFEIQITNYTEDNKPYLVLIRCYPILDPDGKVIHFLSFEREVRD